MKCTKCNCKNSYKAKYCYKCGNKFTEEEIKKASDTGIVKILRKMRNIYDTLTLSKITGSIYYRVFSVLVVIAIGFGGIIINGIHLKINESDNYTYQYNKIDKEYYLYTTEDETKLNLYSLGEKTSIEIEYFDEENNKLEEETFDDFDKVVLKANVIGNNYYIINYKKDSLKLYVYKVESKEEIAERSE